MRLKENEPVGLFCQGAAVVCFGVGLVNFDQKVTLIFLCTVALFLFLFGAVLLMENGLERFIASVMKLKEEFWQPLPWRREP